jgi:hypothetical protein
MCAARYIKGERGFMIDKIFALSNSIRYVAIYNGDQLETKSKFGTVGASACRNRKPD